MSRRRVAVAMVVVLGLVVALGLVRGVAPDRAASGLRRPASPAPTPAVSPAFVDPAALRDVFRFADEAAEGRADDRVRAFPDSPVLEPVPKPPGPRLVGIVRRGGKLLAALGLAGEVELAGAGESAAGVRVLVVDEDGVRIRRPDGSEATLPLE